MMILDDFQYLLESAPRLLRGTPPALPSRQFTVAKRDAPVTFSNNFQRRRTTGRSEIKPGLRSDISVAPAIEHDRGDVASGVEPGIAQHLLQLFANLQFEIRVGCREQSAAGGAGLGIDRNAGWGKSDIEGEHRRLGGVERHWDTVDLHGLTNVAKETETIEPVCGRNAELRKRRPIAHRHDGEQYRPLSKPTIRRRLGQP